MTPTTGRKKLSVAAVVPVGPGHQSVANECKASIQQAWDKHHGIFSSLSIHLINDHKGELGRSAARNKGLEQSAPSDWVLLIDADDLLLPDAFARIPQPRHDAYWGRVCVEQGIPAGDALPCTWETLMAAGATHTLSMGCFIRGPAARETKFLEPLDTGEDFEFYLALLAKFSFLKLGHPLVRIRRNLPSAHGPRGYQTLDWRAACLPALSWWRTRDRKPATYQERLGALTAP